jgi:hypothetical protein
MNQNLTDRASVEDLIGEVSDCLRRIDWAHESGRRVDRIDPIKSYAEKAVAAIIKLAGPDIQDGWIRRRERQGSNRQRLGAIKDRHPRCATVE